MSAPCAEVQLAGGPAKIQDQGMNGSVSMLCVLAACSAVDHEIETVDLSASAAAIEIVADIYQVDVDGVDVAWVTSPMRSVDGTPVRGIANGCDILVQWWSSEWSSGFAADGPAISSTALAHEIAHCALSRSGDSDHGHARIEWWGAGGLVDKANGALRRCGI
jgi:hypothetical protein